MAVADLSYPVQLNIDIAFSDFFIYKSAFSRYTVYMIYGFYTSSAPNPSLSLALRRVSYLKITGEFFMQNDSEWSDTYVAVKAINGSGVVTSEQKGSFAMPEGSLLILRLNKTQRIRMEGKDWQICCFEFLCGSVDQLPMGRVLACEKHPYVETLCEECARLLGSSSVGAHGAASSILAMLLHVWLQSVQADGHKLLHWERIERIKEYMLLHLNENLSVANLARIVDLSERRFRDVFHLQTGMSPKQYLNNLRIVHAETYLLEMPYSIKEIAQRLGYTNQFHFNRAFREVHGMSPTAFRAQKK